MEVWKPCYGYEQYAEVSNRGRVRSIGRYIKNGTKKIFNKSIIYKQSNDKDGYKILSFSFDGRESTERVHRLILLTFNYHDNHKELTVNHIDGVKDNNKLENLEWATHKENTKHAIDMGLIVPRKKKTYEHVCRQCRRRFTTNISDSKYCSQKCSSRSTRVPGRPGKNQLKKDILNMSLTAVGQKYSVSDNAVRKWCRALDLPHKLKDIKEMKIKEGR